MTGFPSKEQVRSVRETYPIGTRVELICMDDPWSKLKPGDRGTVVDVDDAGTVHCRWDTGSGLGLVYGEDQFRKISEPTHNTATMFWRSTVGRHGFREAEKICNRYLAFQSRNEVSDDEKKFCQELREAMALAAERK